ncbi:MAG: hypothetical protein KAJ40_03120 [Alphaproteobacteria bacterium]|nr:hypothetical protein [Alphaproteobacteria bacterium]
MDQQKKEIAQQTVIEDESQNSLVEKLTEKRKIQRKKTFRRIMLACLLLLFGCATWFLFKPFKASADYGICHTMLELMLPYPHTLYVSEVKIKRTGTMELWYTHIDAFGEYRMEPFICNIQHDAANNNAPVITELRMNKISIPQERLAFLNNAMFYFVANPRAFNYPVELSDSLAGLQIETEKFRKIQLDPKR